MSLREVAFRILCCAVIALTGCSSGDNGGSGSSPVASTAQVAGAVNSGEIGGTGLSVLSAQQIATSSVQKGVYTTTVSTSGPQLLFVQDETGATRGLTFSRSSGAGTPTLAPADAESTVLALLFMSPGVVTADWALADQTLVALPQLPSYPLLVSFMRGALPVRSLEEIIQDATYQDLLGGVLDEWPAKAATLSTPVVAGGAMAAFATPPLVTPVLPPPATTTGGVVIDVLSGYTGANDLKATITNHRLRSVHIYRQVNYRCGVQLIVFDDPVLLVRGAKKLKLLSPLSITPVIVSQPATFPCSDSSADYYVVGPGFGATDLTVKSIHDGANMTIREPITLDALDYVVIPLATFVSGIPISDALDIDEALETLKKDGDFGSAVSSIGQVIATKGIEEGAKSAQKQLYKPLVQAVMQKLPSLVGRAGVSTIASLARIGSLFDTGNLAVYLWQIRSLPPYAKVSMSPPYDTVEFSASSYSVRWVDQRADIVVTRNDGSNDAIEVQYTITPGTAIEGRDYQDINPTPGVLKFGPKQLTASIPIALLESRSNTTSRQATLSLNIPDGRVGLVKLGQRSAAALEIFGTQLEGHYSGSFSGTDSGTIEVDIVKTGSTLSASATGVSTEFGYAFTASGTVTSTGAVQLTQGGVSTGAVFSGQLLRLGSTVLLSGTWINKFVPLEEGGFHNGSFSATKIN